MQRCSIYSKRRPVWIHIKSRFSSCLSDGAKLAAHRFQASEDDWRVTDTDAANSVEWLELHVDFMAEAYNRSELGKYGGEAGMGHYSFCTIY